MKNLAFFLFFIFCVPGMFLGIALYIGLFHPVQISQVFKEPLTAVVLPFRGNYQKVGKKIQEVQAILTERGLGCIPIAIYHDDEDKVIHKLLKSEGGCVVKEIPKNLSEDFKILYSPRKEAVEAVIEAHPAIAKTKAFAALRAYSQEKSIELKRPIIALFEGNRASFYFYTANQP